MKNLFTKVKVVVVALLSVVFLTVGGACTTSTGTGTGNETAKVQEFYELVLKTQECLDEVADDIYTYWYDAIYKDKYSGNINLAILAARVDNEVNLNLIETNDATINTLYKEVRDSSLSNEIKDVMSAYSDYYEFVVNVSGSFNSYSAGKEDMKKALASALKRLSLEI